MNIFLTLKGGLSGLVEGDPELDPVPELCEAQPGVLLEPVRHGGVEPAAVLLQRLRRVARVNIRANQRVLCTWGRSQW